MTYVSENQVKQTLTGQPGQQEQGIDPTSFIPGASVGSNQFVGGGASGAAPGAASGGMKPFVNIQSYLAGNQPTQSEAGILKQDAGGIIGGETQKAEAAQTQVKAQGEQERSEKIGVPQATQIIQNAAQGSGDTNTIRQSLDASFDRPQFDYSQGNQFQSIGELFNAGDTQGYANQAYGRHIGGSLSQGQRSLQSQFDALNPYVQEAKQGIVQDYGTAKDNIGGIVDDVGSYMSELEDYYMKADQDLRGGLSGYGQNQWQSAQDLMMSKNNQVQNAQKQYEDAIKMYQDTVGGYQQQFADKQGTRVSYGIPTGFGSGMTTQQRNEFLTNASTMDSDSLYDYFRNIDSNPFDGADIRAGNPYAGMQQAFNTARGIDYNAGEQFTLAGANPTAVKEFNLIQQLLGEGDVADETVAGQQARFRLNQPGVFTGGGY